MVNRLYIAKSMFALSSNLIAGWKFVNRKLMDLVSRPCIAQVRQASNQ